MNSLTPRRTRILVWLANLTCVVGIAVLAAASPQTGDERTGQWRAALRQAFHGVGAALAIDIDLAAQPPALRFSGRMSEADYMALAAAVLKRSPKGIEPGWVLVRTPETVASSGASYGRTAKWLSEVPDDELRRLCRGGVPFSELSRATQVLLASQCSNLGLQMKMANGEFASASLRMQFAVEVRNSDGKSVTLLVDPFSRDSAAEDGRREKLERSYRSPEPVSTPEHKLAGDLDFGTGEVLSLAEAMARASKAFNKTYVCDGRLATSTYYWQGRFAEKEFVKFASEVQRPFDPQDRFTRGEKDRALIQRLLRSKLADLFDPSLAPKGLGYGDALGGKQFSVGELCSMYPSWEKNLTDFRLDRNAVATLAPALELSLVAPGSFADRPNQSPVGNRWSIVFR